MSPSPLQQTDGETPAGPAWLPSLAAGAVGLLAFSATFNLVWNFDIHWHLACGEWMFRNLQVLGSDPFSVDGAAQWINVHWLFQVIVTLGHKLGGFELLSGLKALLAAATAMLLAWPMRKRVPPGFLVLCGFLLVLVIAPRVRVRPEAFTLCFLMATIALVEHVRRGGRTGMLWWLSPIMLLWVNMHGLFFVGPAVFWSALGGAWLDRKLKRDCSTGGLLTPQAAACMVSATVACLVSPWPVEVVAQPLLLWTRISGGYYTYGVSELTPTTQVLSTLPLPIFLAALAGGSLLLRARKAPLAHFVWLAAFIYLALQAKRNIGLAGPVLAYLAAEHGGTLYKAFLDARPYLRPARLVVSGMMILLAVGMSAANVVDLTARWNRTSIRFGPGLQRDNYPIDSARFLRTLPHAGDLITINFGDASVFDYYTWPQRRVYMDGRLEAYSLERFLDHRDITNTLSQPHLADSAKLPPAVRFVFARYSNDSALTALMMSRRFELVYLEPMGAVFARRDWTGPDADAPLPPPNVASLDLPLNAQGLLDGLAAHRRRWYAQNPPSTYTQAARMLAAMGHKEPAEPVATMSPLRQRLGAMAVRYFHAARAENAKPPAVVGGALAESLQNWALVANLPPAPALPLDVHSAGCLYAYNRLDLSNLARNDLRRLAGMRIVALAQARQLEAAERALREFFDRLPAVEKMTPPADLLETRQMIQDKLAEAQTLKRQQGFDRADLARRVEILASPGTGLYEQAIAELQAARSLEPTLALRLGDLLAGTARVREARDQYARVSLPPQQAWKLRLREGLCLWIEGRLIEAKPLLTEAARSGDDGARVYRASLLELLGHHDDLRQMLAEPAPQDPALAVTWRQIQLRLASAQ